MTDDDFQDIDPAELRRKIDDLEETAAELRSDGDELGIPAIERNAKRIEDTIAILRQNVPGGLGRE